MSKRPRRTEALVARASGFMNIAICQVRSSFGEIANKQPARPPKATIEQPQHTSTGQKIRTIELGLPDGLASHVPARVQDGMTSRAVLGHLVVFALAAIVATRPHHRVT
jgi:hypothetical protein